MFDWDENKAAKNLEKHEVSFSEAASAFADPDGLDGADTPHSGKEERRIRVAKSVLGRILTISYTLRGVENEQKKVRIISARRASRKEQKAYKEGFEVD